MYKFASGIHVITEIWLVVILGTDQFQYMNES